MGSSIKTVAGVNQDAAVCDWNELSSAHPAAEDKSEVGFSYLFYFSNNQ